MNLVMSSGNVTATGDEVMRLEMKLVMTPVVVMSLMIWS